MIAPDAKVSIFDDEPFVLGHYDSGWLMQVNCMLSSVLSF
jgi:hypothetical protein